MTKGKPSNRGSPAGHQPMRQELVAGGGGLTGIYTWRLASIAPG
ncbi:hypothetical protein [Streptomyces griseoaurantiacus]